MTYKLNKKKNRNRKDISRLKHFFDNNCTLEAFQHGISASNWMSIYFTKSVKETLFKNKWTVSDSSILDDHDESSLSRTDIIQTLVEKRCLNKASRE